MVDSPVPPAGGNGTQRLKSTILSKNVSTCNALMEKAAKMCMIFWHMHTAILQFESNFANFYTVESISNIFAVSIFTELLDYYDPERTALASEQALAPGFSAHHYPPGLMQQ